MPPATASLSAPRFAVRTASKPGASSSALNSVLTPVMTLNRVRVSSATNRDISRGFVISTFLPPSLTKTNRFAVRANTW